MNKMTKKLLLSVLTVVLTVTALGTTTFAWFTLTNTAVVQPFEAQVVADVGIEISLDDPFNEGVWVTTLTTEMIEGYIARKYNPTGSGSGFFFNAVTSSDGVSMYNLGVPTPINTLGQFLEIGIQFRSNSATSIRWASADVSQTPVGPIPWVTDVAYEHTTGAVVAGQGLNIDVSNGIRMSVAGTVLATPKVLVYEKPGVALGTLATGSGNTVLGKPQIETSPGVFGPTSITHDGTTFVDPSLLLKGALSYYYQKTGELPSGSNSIDVVETFTSFAGDILLREVLQLIPDGLGENIGALYSGQLTIRIWLEGWDPDTFNAVLSRRISATFTFNAPE